MSDNKTSTLPPRWTGNFRKKPVEVQAVQLVDDLRNHTEIAAWIEANGGHCEIPFAEPCLYIQTPDGLAGMRADIGDWIVREATGEFLPYKPDVFDAAYERAAAAREDGSAVQPEPDEDAAKLAADAFWPEYARVAKSKLNYGELQSYRRDATEAGIRAVVARLRASGGIAIGDEDEAEGEFMRDAASLDSDFTRDTWPDRGASETGL